MTRQAPAMLWLLALGLLDAAPARAQIALPESQHPTLAAPLRVRAGTGQLTAPVFTHAGLWPAAPAGLYGLATVEQPGLPLYDPSSRRWLSSANGALVELRPDGSLPVLLGGAALQGRDLDVRLTRGVLVSREPEHRIVLVRFSAGAVRQKRVLLKGSRFFRPRLSPDGSRVLVAESRPGGGHLWLVSDRQGPVDLGPGVDGSFTADGRRILFARITDDGHAVLTSDLWEMELATGRSRMLAQTPHLAEVEPAVSPDGKWLAFVDARSGDHYVARLGQGR